MAGGWKTSGSTDSRTIMEVQMTTGCRALAILSALLVASLAAGTALAQKSGGVLILLSHKIRTSCICVSNDRKMWYIAVIFFRIGGPEWTAVRARGVKRDLRPMSRRSARRWAMPIDRSRCAITAWDC